MLNRIRTPRIRSLPAFYAVISTTRLYLASLAINSEFPTVESLAEGVDSQGRTRERDEP